MILSIASIFRVWSLSILTLSNSFYPQVPHRSRKRVGTSQVASKKNISGSFFNPVPSRDDEDEEKDEILENSKNSSAIHRKDSTPGSSLSLDPFDQSLTELFKKKLNVQNPSSSSKDHGIPLAKAIGEKRLDYSLIIEKWTIV